MSIGITQLIILVIIGILLFGNLPKILKDLGSGIVALKKEVTKEIPEDSKSKDVLSTSPKEENNTVTKSESEHLTSKSTIDHEKDRK